ncbi:MAG: D-inositol 3-phosphate glycosyltransferase [Verrucomicrobiota bacterium]
MVPVWDPVMQANRDNDRKLKILLLESSPHWGGQEDRLIREAVWLQQRGHKVMLACNDNAAIIGRAGGAGVEVRAIPFRANVDVPGLLALAKLVRREQPDIIHAHSSKDAWFSFWFHLAGLPVVRSRHMTLPDTMPRGRRFIYRHGCRRLIAAAGFIARTMHCSLGVPAERIDVIGESVDLEEFTPGDGSEFRREFGIPDKSPLFGIVAMLRGEKGHDTFLLAARRALKQLPEARFVIVGSGTQSSDVEEQINAILAEEFKELPGNRVIMTGFRRDIPRIMRAIDCLVVPSRHEAQTLVIPQAFATGKPAIGSRVGGIPEILKDGENGFLIEPDDVEALADRMLRVGSDSELASRLGGAGKSFAERELGVDLKMEKLLRSYRKAIQAKAA